MAEQWTPLQGYLHANIVMAMFLSRMCTVSACQYSHGHVLVSYVYGIGTELTEAEWRIYTSVI